MRGAGAGMRLLVPILMGPALFACGGDADRTFAQLEEGLLSRPELDVRFHITSEGAFAAELEGDLKLGVGGGASLTAEGTFGGEMVTLFLSESDGRLRGGNQERTFEEEVPPALREALVIGLTRMGLLHNLARLVSGSPPDRADETVREWVQVRQVARETPRGDGTGSKGLRFDIWVAGQLAGEATLWLDERGVPVRREQVVRFPTGEMRVVERYEAG